MLRLYKQKAFKKSLKKYKYNDVVLEELEYIVSLLVKEQEIPKKYGSSPFLGVNLHTRCNPLNPRTIFGNMTLV